MRPDSAQGDGCAIILGSGDCAVIGYISKPDHVASDGRRTTHLPCDCSARFRNLNLKITDLLKCRQIATFLAHPL